MFRLNHSERFEIFGGTRGYQSGAAEMYGTMNDFTAIMRKRTDAELLAITTTQRGDYQPDALLAAEAEWKSRDLTAQQVADAQQEIEQAQREMERKEEKRRRVETKISDFAGSLHPLTGSSIDRIIKILTVGLTLDLLFELWRGWGILVYILKDAANIDVSMLLFLVPFILLPLGLYGFWRIQKYGWVILVMLMTYNGFSAFSSLAITIKYELLRQDEYGDIVYGGAAIPYYLGQLVLLIAILYLLNKRGMTARYGIDRRMQLWTIGLTAPLILAGLAMSFY